MISHLQLADFSFFRFGINGTCVLEKFDVKPVLTVSSLVLSFWPGKAVGSLNLGNFFASHKGYSHQGFDQLSTEGSDQERNDEDSSDSENEEYYAPNQSSS